MEDRRSALEDVGLDKKFWQEKNVFLTGHSGFKGSWFVLFLQALGANVVGYSLSCELNSSDSLTHFKLIESDMFSYWADISNPTALQAAILETQPDIVFHLAAQALVRTGYQDPAGTYNTNVIGTLNVLEAVRNCPSVRAVVIVTTDKCYENKEWIYPYREIDPLGGYDPYSSSKACAEIVVQSYRRSFFPLDAYGESHHTLVASARAGNVIGGGDWSNFRLIPDIIRAWQTSQPLASRHPQAVRPWQHVLESLTGYMLLAEKLYSGDVNCAQAYNFGPNDNSFGTVECIIKQAQQHLPGLEYNLESSDFHEAGLLRLDSTKAKNELGFYPVWNMHQAVEKSLNWYRVYYQENQIISMEDVENYLKDMDAI